VNAETRNDKKHKDSRWAIERATINAEEYPAYSGVTRKIRRNRKLAAVAQHHACCGSKPQRIQSAYFGPLHPISR
jgi:hypothetical protein